MKSETRIFEATVRAGGAEAGGLADKAFFAAARPRLVIANDALKRTEPITKAEFFVGRRHKGEEAADCVIAHDAVSGRHAKITYAHKRFRLADLESKNFTFVGKEMLAPGAPRELKPDTHVRFGSVDALFVMDVDYDGAEVDVERHRTALRLLESDRRITKIQRERVTALAAEHRLHLGEALLLEGLATTEQWVDALERARLVEAVADQGSQIVRRGGAGKIVAAALFVLVLGVAVLVATNDAARNAVLKIFGRGG
jgi:pSer/pThr/pTyr-binding forkhead associated (FHA) protein